MLPLHRAEDFYVRAIGNLAVGNKIPEAQAEEIRFVERNYPVAAFKGLLNEKEWSQTCYLLSRGGIFKKYEDVFDGENFKHGVQKVLLYNEELAGTRNALTGALFPGSLTYLSPTATSGKAAEQTQRDFPFALVSYKMNLHTQSRTTWHQWAMEVVPENTVMVNQADADACGVKTGDKVRLVSRSNPEGVVGKAQVTQLVRKGCVAISFHYGHTQLGASALTVKDAETVFLGKKTVASGNRLHANPALGTGVNPNTLSDLAPDLANTPVVETLSGIPDFSSTRVRLIKVG
jgi:tetrathionate reductase subunit A